MKVVGYNQNGSKMTFLKGVVDGLSYIHRFSVILYSNQNRTLFLKWSLFSCLQEVANQLARLSVRACGRLGGYFPESSGLETPENVPVKKSLSAILTPYLSRKLSHENPSEVYMYM
jgi:hypothetical protein